jgi:RNA polymerase sigma-70 factor, ECF subfamily
MGPVHKPGDVPDPQNSELALAQPRPRPISAADAPAMPPSFEAVYRAHAKTVSCWASRLLGPGGDCQDVVQEVFLVVRRKLPQFTAEAEITTWLFEITAHVVQDFRKRRRWWSWLTGRGENPSRGKANAVSPREETTQDPQAVLEARERIRFLYRILDELGETYRTTFILFELEGLSGERIAEITGTSVGSVWVRLHRARHRFIERMRELEAKEAP